MPTVTTNNTITAPIQKVIYAPNDSNTLMAFGGNHHHQDYGDVGITCWGAVWKSTNGGDYWTKLHTLGNADIAPDNDLTGVNIDHAGFAAGSSSTLFACSYQAGVYKSTNGGSNWAKANGGLPTTATWMIALHPTNPEVLWVSLGGAKGIYKSTNAGAGWFASSTGISSTDMAANPWNMIAVANSNPDYLYCASGIDWTHPMVVYRSTNGAANWTRIVYNRQQLPSQPFTSLEIAFRWIGIDPHDETHLAGSGSGRLLRSTNSGTTWKDVSSFSAAGGWRGNGYSGQCALDIAWNPYRLGHVFTLAMDSGKLLRSENSLWSWKLCDRITGDGGYRIYNGGNQAAFSSDGTIYIGAGQGSNGDAEEIIKSTNAGATWGYTAWPGGASGPNRAVVVHPTNSGHLWAVIGTASSAAIYRSTNGGSAWTAPLITSTATGEMFSLAADFSTGTTIYLGARTGVYKSIDGTTFLLLSGSPKNSSSDGFGNEVKIDPVTPSTVYATAFREGSAGAYRSTNSGATWKKLSLSQHQNAKSLAIDPADTRRMALITSYWPGRDTYTNAANAGVWISTNDGGNWKKCNIGLGELRGSTIAFNPDKSSQLIVGTDGAGFYVTDLGTSTPFAAIPTTPVRIQVEDFDLGGEGFAYHDSTAGNQGGDGYRSDGVDLRSAGAGHVLSNAEAGEWIKYKVNIAASGTYHVILRAASASATGKFHLEANGVNVTGPISVPSTGGINNWADVVVPNVRLIAGTQYLKLYVEASGAEIDYIQVGNTITSSLALNGGAAQRSQIQSASVNFDRSITLDIGAILLSHRTAGAVTVTPSNPSADGKTWVLNFSGTLAPSGRLVDGVYDLTVLSSKVHASDATLGTDQSYSFHRLFGDYDGNKTVNNVDIAWFRRALDTSSGSANYRSLFDFDANGTINNVDLAQFRRRIDVTMIY